MARIQYDLVQESIDTITLGGYKSQTSCLPRTSYRRKEEFSNTTDLVRTHPHQRTKTITRSSVRMSMVIDFLSTIKAFDV